VVVPLWSEPAPPPEHSRCAAWNAGAVRDKRNSTSKHDCGGLQANTIKEGSLDSLFFWHQLRQVILSSLARKDAEGINMEQGIVDRTVGGG
jgi:hypothetical protein